MSEHEQKEARRKTLEIKGSTYNFDDGLDGRAYIHYTLDQSPQLYGAYAVEIVNRDGRLFLTLEDFSKLARYHLRELGYLILTPEELATLRKLPDYEPYKG